MAAGILACRLLERRSNPVQGLAAAGALTLLLDPEAAGDAGFQLSYLSVAGILLARWSLRDAGQGRRTDWGSLAHDVLFGKSVLLLMGGLIIGAVAGEAGTAPIKAVFIDPFKGVLALFLLELGLVAGGRLAEVRRFGPAVLVIGLAAPPLLALAGAATGWALGLSTGGVALLATLAASASYIAAPTAMRIAVPQANAALSITAALGITFPFNIVIGIPMYIELARWLERIGA
jgi:hypothetical protein